MRGHNARYSADPDVRRASSRVQIIRFGVASGQDLAYQAADQIGGSARVLRKASITLGTFSRHMSTAMPGVLTRRLAARSGR